MESDPRSEGHHEGFFTLGNIRLDFTGTILKNVGHKRLGSQIDNVVSERC